MTLTQLRAFLAAATSGTFSGAAADLRMSQPAVSDLVRRLENELGAALFTRGPRSLALTAAGQQLLPHAERCTTSAAAGVDAVKELRELSGGRATFGVLRNADLYLRDNLARRFNELHPNVRIRLVGQNSAETAEDVRLGRLEAGLVSLPVAGEDDLDVLPVVRDEILYVSADPARVAVPPSTNDICARKMVLYDAHYASSDPLRRQVAERAQAAGVHLDPVIEVEYLAPALDLVAAGIGDSFVPHGAVASEVRPRNLHTTPLAQPLHDAVALIRRRGHPLSPATTEFVRLAHEALLAHNKTTGSTTEVVRGQRTIRHFLS